MKKLLALFSLAFLITAPLSSEPWGGKLITVTAGTAIRIVTISTRVSSFVAQMATAGTGRGYLLYAPIGVTCTNGGAGTTLIAELQPATSTAPGGNVTVPSNTDPYGGIDLAGYCVDGSNSGDVINVAFNIRN